MKIGEIGRARFVFGGLGLVPVLLAGWFGYVQVGQAATLEGRGGQPLPLVAATAERQAWRVETVPAPRGTKQRPRARQARTTAATSSVVAGRTTAAGSSASRVSPSHPYA